MRADHDVYDARGQSGSYWKRRMREENKTVALGAPCGDAGHRLRTRAGHRVQCDPKKLAFQARHSAEQYVYIAGSVSDGLIKIGTCKDVPQRYSPSAFPNSSGRRSMFAAMRRASA
jgi:hypothetical protein